MPRTRPYQPPKGHQRLKMHLSWDGAGFVGWQSQPGQRSVQDTLQAACTELLNAPFRAVAAGRTDAGVHALDMCIHLDILEGSLRPPLSQLPRALNARLGPDLAVLSAEEAPPGFHARFSCLERRYLYRILNAEQRRPLWHGRALHVPQPLNASAMREAAQSLIGLHDFAAYATQEERQTWRELRALSVTWRGELIEIELRGESFLRHMVRAIVGTLLQVGLEKRPVSFPAEVLASRERQRAGANVSPQGLYFAGSLYP